MAAILMATAAPVQADAAKSFFPQKGLARFIVNNLDLATFPSAVGPRLSPSKRSFAAMGLKLQRKFLREDFAAVSDSDGLSMYVSVIKRGDFNHDGLEDVVICQQDVATYGHLDATQPYFLTRYSAVAPVVAIARDVVLAPEVCDWDPPKDQR